MKFLCDTTLKDGKTYRLPLWFKENLDFAAQNVVEEFFKDEFKARRVRLFNELLHNTCSTEGGCLIWLGPYDPSGYGVVTKSKYGWRRAHIAAFCIGFGYSGVMPGMSILHSCNNRACINPLHLREGTAKDNAADLKKYRQEVLGHTYSRE